MSRTYLCDKPGCQSSCELDHRVTDSDVLVELTKRGWLMVNDGEIRRHYCPTHHEAAYAEREPETVPKAD